MESMPPARQNHQTEVVDLDLLARVICDRIGNRFTLELECHGCRRSLDILSRETISTLPLSPSAIDPSASISEKEKIDALALLTQDIVYLLSQRLRIEQERQGHFSGRLPW